MVECPVCGASIIIEKDAVLGEILECQECGSELELSNLEPLTLTEAPQEEEDWGE